MTIFWRRIISTLALILIAAGSSPTAQALDPLNSGKVLNQTIISPGSDASLGLRGANMQILSSSGFNRACGWCGTLVTLIEIGAFVVAAPTMTPIWMTWSVYSMGSLIIFQYR